MIDKPSYDEVMAISKGLREQAQVVEELAQEKNVQELFSQCEFLAQNIEKYRKENALELSKLIEKKLKTLELQQAQFQIELKEVEYNELGKNSVEFMISTNKNQSPMPLSRVASGGEISRVMLALKNIFARCDKVQTVVFDEIDTGISGVTSNAVAQSLIELSHDTQIISITHQPIIAAKADNFIWVSKKHSNNTSITIENLNDDRRLKALAQIATGVIDEKTVEFAKSLV